jgi:UDP-MurNAc hydroxylase
MGGWQSFPEFSVSSMANHLVGTRWVYISHLHDDHFDPWTLQALGLMECEFIIKRFATPILRDRLRRLGASVVHEIDPFTLQRFDTLELAIFPQMTSNSDGLEDDVNYELDTSIAFKGDGAVFFNQVDNPLSLNDLKKIKTWISMNMGDIDVSCLMSGAASEYPHLFLSIDTAAEKERIISRSLMDLTDWLRLLRPRVYFPAGGTYLIPGWLSRFNDLIAQPSFDDISQFLAEADVDVRAINLEGGRSLEVASSGIRDLGLAISPTVAVRAHSIERHVNDTYAYEDSPTVPFSTLQPLLEQARANWQSRVTLSSIRIRQRITLRIYPSLPNDFGSAAWDTYILTDGSQDEAGDLVIHIDSRAVLGCLTRRFIWNGVLGSLCLYERRPNTFYPADVFSLNYLTLSHEQVKSM